MRIKPQVSSVRETITTTLGSRVPIVDTSEVDTSVKIKDGAMMMVAGLSKWGRRDDRSGLPVLEKMPIADLASGSGAWLNKRTEFVVFMTPHIVKGDSASPEPADVKSADIEIDQLQDKLKGMKIAEIH
jgi:type II secretory pathway component GspD/PulD (secretin)